MSRSDQTGRAPREGRKELDVLLIYEHDVCPAVTVDVSGRKHSSALVSHLGGTMELEDHRVRSQSISTSRMNGSDCPLIARVQNVVETITVDVAQSMQRPSEMSASTRKHRVRIADRNINAGGRRAI